MTLVDPIDDEISPGPIPYRRLDGYMSGFDMGNPSCEEFPSRVYAAGSLYRAVDLIEHDVVWIEEGSNPRLTLEQLAGMVAYKEREVDPSFVSTEDLIAMELSDEPDPLSQRIALLHSHLLTPPRRLVFYAKEITPDGAVSWCGEHGVDVPAILWQDLAQRRKARKDTHPTPRGDVAAAGPPGGTSASPDTANPTEQTREPSPANSSHRDRETQLREFFRENPAATSQQACKATKIPESTIRKSQAWKALTPRQKDRKPPMADALFGHSVPLTREMEAVIAARSDDPDAVAKDIETIQLTDDPDQIERERLEREYIEHASPTDRAEYYKMAPGEKRDHLLAWKLTGVA
jgi:hypothetical protein